jgi:seryl-tRNA synthetase
MLDLKLVTEKPDLVTESLQRRASDQSVDPVLEANQRRRDLLHEVEGLRAEVNSVGPQIGALMREGRKDEAMALREQAAKASTRLKELAPQLTDTLDTINELLLGIPNVLDRRVPAGGEADARLERTWGEPTTFDFPVRHHADIGKDLGILDLERAAKIAGARFSVLLGAGAALSRALKDFMLDLHTTEHGYTEVMPPFLCNTDAFIGTGQLPKFAGDLFRVADPDRFWLIPTAEVPVTNLHRDEILTADEVEKAYVAYTPCFRSEAGAAGKDTRGMMRQHQFEKVELVRITTPERGEQVLEELTGQAEKVLQLLDLPYRVVTLAGSDTGFSSSITYDIEVWLPSEGEAGNYREISSCSLFRDYQARRMNLRYRPAPKAKPRHPYTLNGSGLAIGRTLIAILENFQQADGSVVVPEPLRHYLRRDVITP